MKDFVTVYKKRTDLRDMSRLIIQTASGEGILSGVKAVSFVNGVKSECSIEKNDKSSLNYVYINSSMGFDGEYDIFVKLPEKPAAVKVVLSDGKRSQVIKVSKASVKFLQKTMEYHVDSIARKTDAKDKEDKVTVTGWCASAGELKVSALKEMAGISSEVSRYSRENIMMLYLPGELNKKVGFQAQVSGKNIPNSFKMTLVDDNREVSFRVRTKQGKLTNILNKLDAGLKKCRLYLAMYGIKGFVSKAFHKFFKNESTRYSKYFKEHFPDKYELERQRTYTFSKDYTFSIVMPVFRPNTKFFRKMLDSVCAQTYPNWQICLADGGGEGFYVDKVLAPYIARYGTDKIKYIKLGKNLGIAANTNEALKAATGDYIVFGDHDDEFHPSALYEVMALLEKHPDAQFIYTDEDKVIGGGRKHTNYHFKSDFNQELLNHNHYICHMTTVSRGLFEKVGYLDSRFDGAQDFDFALRCSENTKSIYHIPKVLYYWRIHAGSTASAPSAKDYAFVAGKNALQEHFKRQGIEAEVTDALVPGFYDVKYKYSSEELISVIIPNKDHIEDLNKCIGSIEEKSTYRNLEYVIVENNSVLKDTFEGYEALKNKYPDRIKVVDYGKGVFNYSAINNFGVKHAKGNVFLFLNNDTSLLEEASIGSMYAMLLQENVGIVGSKLLYSDNTVQHGGVVLGFLGVAGHAFMNIPDEDFGYMCRAVLPQDVSAVTAACMMVRRQAYEAAGGFDEELAVAFNDIDFCMKVGMKGYRIVYDAYSKFYHYESKSRGLDNNAEKIERFNSEIALFLDRYSEQLKAGDPYYNCNFSLNVATYRLR